MSAHAVGGRSTQRAAAARTAASAWHAIAGASITDELLEWPPDVFALANTILAQTEAFRFCLSPVGEWPPSRYLDWPREVEEAGREWGVWVEDRRRAIPGSLTEEWSAFCERADAPLDDALKEGRDWRMCEALLTLHAIADEACAGLGVALDSSHAKGCVYRARGRELLVRTGSLARISPTLLRVLPKVCTPPTGKAAFSRYACVQGPGIEARWHKMPTRHRGTDPQSEHAKMLLLPWPLEVRESDFHALEGSVQRLDREPFGFYEFQPAERLDFDLLDRVLVAARREARSVDVVFLPESAVDEDEIEELEALLDSHGAVFVHAGVRGRARQPGGFRENWLHNGVNPRLQKGGTLSDERGGPWFHIRQRKHHRWSLDEAQIYQYHLAGALHPRIRWWEAIDVPRRAIEFIEVAELTVVSLVCEDLAQSDEIAALIRSVGPTVVSAILLDGPQLSSRWAARYASVLADDPGSAVLTLTSFGMVQRSRPHQREASRVIALWKDAVRGFREIPLEPGAHGVLLTVCMDRAARRSSDGRWPVDNGTYLYDASVTQIRAASEGSGSLASHAAASTSHLLQSGELTILTAWAEAVAEALAYAPESVESVLAEASSGAQWRDTLELAQPSARLGEAIDSMGRVLRAVDHAPTFDALVAALAEDRPGELELDGLVRRVVLSMLEQRRTRHTRSPW
jgi:hypothetical protein